MARRVGGPPAKKTREFTPAAYGNREAPECDRVVVWIEQPTEGQKREAVASIEDAVSLDTKDGQSKVTLDALRMLRVRDELVIRFVSKVANYTANDGTPIESGSDLVAQGETDFVREIADEILGRLDLSAEEKKHSVESSGSTEAGTPASSGTAASASDSDSTPSEAAA